jgi:hypothetical protein
VEDQFVEIQDENPIDTVLQDDTVYPSEASLQSDTAPPVDTVDSRKKPDLPLLALTLVLAPFFLLPFLSSIINVVLETIGLNLSGFFVLCIIVSPIAGLIMAFNFLRQGNEEANVAGRTLAIATIALSLSLVALVSIYSIGVTAGFITPL